MQRLLALVALVAMAAVALTGCTVLKATGGGWIDAEEGDGKATFGFGVVCNEDKDALQGGWTYHDKSVEPPINAHGNLNWKDGVPCKFSVQSGQAFLKLPYRATPGNQGGEVKIILDDTGEVGPNKGDYIRVIFLDGPYAGYNNGGLIGGGQIKVETPD